MIFQLIDQDSYNVGLLEVKIKGFFVSSGNFEETCTDIIRETNYYAFDNTEDFFEALEENFKKQGLYAQRVYVENMYI